MISGSAVPDELIAIRVYVGKCLNIQDNTRRFLDPIIQYANLRSQILRRILSRDDRIQSSMEVDAKLQALDLSFFSPFR